MRFLIVGVAAFGCVSSAKAFGEELRGGKLYPSLFFASIAWVLVGVGALFLWRD
jgi:hypothetical protein